MKRLITAALALATSLTMAAAPPPAEAFESNNEVFQVASSTQTRYYFTIRNADKYATISVKYFGKYYYLKPNTTRRFYVDTTNRYGNVSLGFDKIAGNGRRDPMSLSLNAKFKNLVVWRTNSHYLTWEYTTKPYKSPWKKYKFRITNTDKYNTISYYMYSTKYVLKPGWFREHTIKSTNGSTMAHLSFDRKAGDGKYTILRYDFSAKEYNLEIYRDKAGIIQHQVRKKR